MSLVSRLGRDADLVGKPLFQKTARRLRAAAGPAESQLCQFDERGLPMNSTNDNTELRGQPSGEGHQCDQPIRFADCARAWRRLGAL